MLTDVECTTRGSVETPFISTHDRDETCNEGRRLKIQHQSSCFHHRSFNMFQTILIFLLATWGLACLVLLAVRRLVFPGPLEPDVYRPETLPRGLTDCYCGVTIDEARALNCVYDTLSTAWLPPYCRDDELTEEFDRAGPGANGAWEYFADSNGTSLLTRHEIGLLGETGSSFWTSRDWHIAHCLFYWQKYHRMRITNIVMEKRFDTMHHIKHCSRLARNPVPDHFFLIEVPVQMNSTE
ncbi:hypothetical protein ANO14919_078750 [Xylariales sp. No.14919]|nr:hypothetical protein ANO14919_078750 [Xylariales sp. No.14919]